MAGLAQDVIGALIAATRTAGDCALNARCANMAVRSKSNGSPVTAADLDVESHLRRAVAELAPETPVVSEESWTAKELPSDLSRYFLIDPIDGTREYISGLPEFTLNIALIEKGFPIFGIVFAPALDRLFFTSAGSAFEQRSDGMTRTISCLSQPLRDPPIVLISRSHLDAKTEAALSEFPGCTRRSVGSALKFALIAAGEADIYIRLAPTMVWDTAAGQALIEAAGGAVLTDDGARLSYAPGAQTCNPGFIAARNATLALKMSRAVRG